MESNSNFDSFLHQLCIKLASPLPRLVMSLSILKDENQSIVSSTGVAIIVLTDSCFEFLGFLEKLPLRGR